MGSSTNRRGQVAALSSPVSAVLIELQTELHNLVTRRQELVRRIRSLHFVVRGLREIANPTAFECLGGESPQPAGESSTTELSEQRRPIPTRSRERPQSHIRCELSPEDLSLQRACRIALLEAEGAASLEEIYERIGRRGSFSVGDLNSASQALPRVLHVMAEDGEVRLLESDSGHRWERIARLKEA